MDLIFVSVNTEIKKSNICMSLKPFTFILYDKS